MSHSAAPTPPPRNPTRAVRIGSVVIGAGRPIVVQSMCATKTSDTEATLRQVELLHKAGAGVVRVAVDTRRDVAALRELRGRTKANLSVDLQENFPLAAEVAPWVDKLRYNPGHLFHRQPERPWQDKVRWLAEVAGEHGCALRVGLNCGSVDPAKREKYGPHQTVEAMLESAGEHCELLDRLGFTQYCVSLKDSNPARVVELNVRFAAERPEVPLHLGVTEAGLPPEGVLKTRAALEELLLRGIGDTIRVSLSVPAERKSEEVKAGRQIIEDVRAGRLLARDELARYQDPSRRGLEIICCPSCSRVENAAFMELAERVREATRYAAGYPLTIAVMGCRVNGPGETDTADLGLWCGPNHVNLKRGRQHVGRFSYEEIVPRLLQELDAMIAGREEPNG